MTDAVSTHERPEDGGERCAECGAEVVLDAEYDAWVIEHAKGCQLAYEDERRVIAAAEFVGYNRV